MPVPSTIHAPPISEVEFLVNAVSSPREDEKSFKERSKKFMSLLFDLERKDRSIAGIYE